MNWEEIKGNWTQAKGKLRSKYADLTDDEIEGAKANRDQLVGLITEKYGKAKSEVEEEVNKLLEDVN